MLSVIEFYSPVDLKVRFFPLLPNVVPVDERTVENLVMEVECNKAVVSIDGSVVVEVEGVDVTRM